jgi:Uma2 family endonuclease
MAAVIRQYTLEEFEQMLKLPENADKRLEYVGGEVVELVSNNYSSKIGLRIGARILDFVESRNLGHVTGTDGGYIVANERYIPDVAFVSITRQPETNYETYNKNAPDLAVEVLSPTDRMDVMRLKLANYLAAKTVVWIIDPIAKTVEVYTPNEKSIRLGINDTLEGGLVLPGFQLPLKDLFRP